MKNALLIAVVVLLACDLDQPTARASEVQSYSGGGSPSVYHDTDRKVTCWIVSWGENVTGSAPGVAVAISCLPDPPAVPVTIPPEPSLFPREHATPRP
jgi:hypothetical protein